MKKFANFTINKKYFILILIGAITILSAFLMRNVIINYNISDYLDKDTGTSMALKIMEDEFGPTGNLQVLVENVDEATAKKIKGQFEAIPNVLNVTFDVTSTSYYKDHKALYVFILDSDDYSEEAVVVIQEVRNLIDREYINNGYFLAGSAMEKKSLKDSIMDEIPLIILISVLICFLILMLTATSWIEPLIFLGISLVGIVINLGTNILLGEISYITNSVSAILQLALSMDYGIVLLHRYHKNKADMVNINEAMKKTLVDCANPISSSALTTIAGLLALLFMSFRIGFDIGMVLMKGILISAILSFTLLPIILLLSDKAMRKTSKKSLNVKGKSIAKLTVKWNKIILPVALFLVILGFVAQANNEYSFTDSKVDDQKIVETFGKNNSVIVLFKNLEDRYEKQNEFISKLETYELTGGKKLLSNYTAYINTVREEYTIKTAASKLEMDEAEVKLLFSMVHLYQNPDQYKMSLESFLAYCNSLIETDDEVKEFIDADTQKLIQRMNAIYSITLENNTSSEFLSKLNSGVLEGFVNVDSFSINQIYGLFNYENNLIANPSVSFNTMLNYILLLGKTDQKIQAMIGTESFILLEQLSAGMDSFLQEMNQPMTQEMMQSFLNTKFGLSISQAQIAELYKNYFLINGLTEENAIPLLKMLQFMVSINLIEGDAKNAVNDYAKLYQIIQNPCEYQNFIPILNQVGSGLSGNPVEVAVAKEAIQQFYILYFNLNQTMPNTSIKGSDFVSFTLNAAKNNPIIQSQLTPELLKSLEDMKLIHATFSDQTDYSFQDTFTAIANFSQKIQSQEVELKISLDKISGVFIKYLAQFQSEQLNPIMAYQLLDFVVENMNTNELLIVKMNEDRKKNIQEAQKQIVRAKDLFEGEHYSRMVLQVNLPTEGEESFKFAEYINQLAKEVFGEESYVAGEILSTYDMKETFQRDQLLINLFTFISILLIVMIAFKSLSIPVILTLCIEGAIWIGMAMSVITAAPIFFMSYIVVTCILMGATIDYGILISTNYLEYRKSLDKRSALEAALKLAMPSIFTSSLILITAGFVIFGISSEISISTVGLLLGRGTIISLMMILFVLPSILWVLDKFIQKTTYHKKA